MKNEQDKKLDNLFKKRLENPDTQSGYREGDWDALEDMLDKRKKRTGIVYLLPIISGVAAMTLVFVGLWFVGHKTNHINHQPKTQITKAATPKTNNGTLNNDNKAVNNEGNLPKTQLTQQNNTNNYSAGVIQNQPVVNPTAIGKINIGGNAKKDSLSNKASILLASGTNNNKTKDSIFEQTYAKNHPLYKGPSLRPQIDNGKGLIKNDLLDPLDNTSSTINSRPQSPVFVNNNINNNALIPTPQPVFSPQATPNTSAAQKPASSVRVPEQQLTAAEKSNAAMMKLLQSTSPDNNNKLSAKTQAMFKRRFTGGVIGASDINSTGSLKQGKVGSKAGLVFAAGLSQKFTVSTGAVYSNTPYAASYDNFSLPYQPKVAPTSMSANCQMLDIPINVGYQVYSQGKNMISVGTGLSSYIMLQQDYNFMYAGTSGTTSRDYSVPNSASYLFKILNLNATYERQISSKAGITVQPYLKLPLADVGYSQVKLQSTGIAVGLSWNLDSSQP